MSKTQSKMAKPAYKKIDIDNSKIWALWGQVIFALFIIIAFFAISFEGYVVGTDGEKAKEASKHFLSEFGSNSDIFGLGVTALVFAFVGIVMPAVSFFYKNDKVNFFLGLGTILFDAIALATVLAVAGLFGANNNATKNYHTIHSDKTGLIYDQGYLAGQIIFELLGAIIAGLGIYSSYKEDLVNKETIAWLGGNKKSAKAPKAEKTVKAEANGKNDDVVIIGDEDNKSFTTQEKEIDKVNKAEEKETKKDAEAVYGTPDKKESSKSEKSAAKRDKASEKKLKKQKKTLL